MAPAHPHATGVAVYPALFLSKDKVYKDIEAEILPKIKDILRTKPSLRFEKNFFIDSKSK